MFRIKKDNILVIQWVTALMLYKDFYSIEQVPKMLGLREVVQEVKDELEAEQNKEKAEKEEEQK